MKYVALLRGINVGGKNPVRMADLKACFETIGFTNVSTYINSGNVIFEVTTQDTADLVIQCEAIIEKAFGFHVICAVIAATDLIRAVGKAPGWWGKSNTDKHNAIIVIAPVTARDVMEAVGQSKPEYERVAAVGPIILWTAPLTTFSRTRYSKIVAMDLYQSVTIRNANTTRKLAELCQ